MPRNRGGPRVAINHKPRLLPGSPYFGEQFLAEAKRQGRQACFWDKDQKPDLVLVIDCTKELERLEEWRRAGVRIVQRVDGVGIVNAQEPRKDNFIFQTSQKADAIIFQSNFCREIWLRAFPLEKPSTIIYNGADERVFSREGKKRNFGFERLMVTGARWRPWKSLDQVVEVFLKRDRQDLGLVVAGDGAEVPKHPRIIATGKLSHKQMAEVFRAADLFIYLPWQEWCPKVVSQALVAGLPVVCSYRGGTRELVSDCGMVVRGAKDNDLEDFGRNPVDIDETVKAVETVLARGERCRPRPDLHLSFMVERYFDFFEKTLAGKE